MVQIKRGWAGEVLRAAGSRRDQTVPGSVKTSMVRCALRRCGGRLGT